MSEQYMTSSSERTPSLIDALLAGAHYWKRLPCGTGHSLVIPDGTLFRIALDGPKSHVFVTGRYRDSAFYFESGVNVGRSFRTPSQAVNGVRQPSSNAFLYIQFLMDGRWIVADEMRNMKSFEPSKIEEAALELAQELLRGRTARLPRKKSSRDALKAACF